MDSYNKVYKKHFKELIDTNMLVEYRSYDTVVDNKNKTWFYTPELFKKFGSFSL